MQSSAAITAGQRTILKIAGGLDSRDYKYKVLKNASEESVGEFYGYG